MPQSGRRPRDSQTTTADEINRRSRETALNPRDAEALAYAEVRRRIRAGEDFQLPRPSDLLDLGRRLAASPSSRAGPKPTGVVETVARSARATAESLAVPAGIAVGAVQRAGEAAVGTAKALKFANRLVNPLDPLMAPKGKAAWGQFASGVADTLYATGGAIVHPVETAKAAQKSISAFRLRADPSAAPPAPKFGDEVGRKLNAGRAQGQAIFDIAALATAAAPAKVALKLDRLRVPSGPEKYLGQGHSPKAALYLSEPYDALGHHVIPQAYRLPAWLGGGPLPKRYSESPYNVLKPEAITRGDMYELHYTVDPHFRGTGFDRSLPGESWRGSAIGLEKAGWGARQWLGTPTPMKTRVGGGGAVVGNVAAGDRETRR